jgi:hypothetical protein
MKAIFCDMGNFSCAALDSRSREEGAGIAGANRSAIATRDRQFLEFSIHLQCFS